jgi:hypothetical protein
MDDYLVYIEVGEFVLLLIIENDAVLIEELRDGNFPNGGSKVLQNQFVDPFLE